MKYLKPFLCFLLTLSFAAAAFSSSALANEADDPSALPISIEMAKIEGAVPDPSGGSGSSRDYVCYPVLIAHDGAYAQTAERISRAIEEKARIPEYIQLLSTLAAGGTGLKVDCFTGRCGRVLSVLFSAEGKMLRGRPSHVYYPMTFDLLTGEEIAFDRLFRDPDGAKAFIEEYLEREVEPSLSTYLENSQLYPVPFDRFFLDSYGHVILVYENSQLSFLSGQSGAVSFRYSQLSPWLDGSPDGMFANLPRQADDAAQSAWLSLASGSLISSYGFDIVIGQALDAVLREYHPAADPGYYPGGACLELEAPVYRGALILTDEQEEKVTGILTGQLDLFDLETGRTTLAQAQSFLGAEPAAVLSLDASAAEMYCVCPGTAAIYPMEESFGVPYTFTLYADTDGIVQFVKLSSH